MKKLIALFTVIGLLTFGISNMAFAQKDNKKSENTKQTTTEKVDTTQQAATPVANTEKVQKVEDTDNVVQESLH